MILFRKIYKLFNGTIDGFTGDYFFLSNYYEVPITYAGEPYGSSEAAYQASKFAPYFGINPFVGITPDESKRLGKSLPDIRPDWDDIRYSMMYNILKYKFNQHPDLRQKLIETYPKYLEEGNTWGDKYWGTVNGRGKNNLGKILMELRDYYM